VDVTLQRLEPVAKVLILNTQNGYSLDRATDLARVDLLAAGAIVSSHEMHLKRYPDWTEFEFAGALSADALRVTIVSFRAKGGGLNEIKILRR
jgi:hypothetical protein